MSDDAIPAATLVVVRDRPGAAPELLMVERSEGMAFAAGALVFPGGRIDEADRRLGERLGADAAAIAAIRETIEETAVPAGLASSPRPEHCLEIQAALVAGEDFADILEQAGVALDPNALTPFARWVPRFHAVRRFDTMFYLARAPEGDWQPQIVAGECAGACWISAAEALAQEQRAETRLIFPTRRNLERIAQHSSFADMRADALAHPIEPVTPWVEEREGEKFVTIPGHLGYPVTAEKLDGLWRG
ncbi:MAG TPA: NUDIX domain-containing protein [Sphingomicrobium sp.]|nr:NUDIX domain-containing protein [Sphingomicrobium sp.]